MMPERWRRIESIFHSAKELEPTQRKSFLDKACAEDPSLRREVESLIACFEQAGEESFLKSPVVRPKSLAERLIGETLDEKYRIESLLGKGGMGAVYFATHLGTGRPVAVKVIAPQFMANQEFVERFKWEAKAAGLLRHPNVVNVTDFGFTEVNSDRLAYLVMEYLDGCTLGQKLKQRGQLPLGLVVDIVEQVCLAMDEAHKRGIVHRDLKPDNIWLEPTGRGGYNVKILDFGLAKLRDAASAELTSGSAPSFAQAQSEAITPIKEEEKTLVSEDKTRAVNRGASNGAIDPPTVPQWLTRAGMVLGTPLYMSPEQCRGDALDARSDIYSLGVVVYEILAGETPFSGDIDKLIVKHNEMPPPPLRVKRKETPKPIADLVMRALAKNALERPQTASAFAAALRANFEGEVPIMRQAIDLYRKNFSTFFRISSLIYLPFAILSFLPLVWLTSQTLEIMQTPSAHFIHRGGYWLFSLLIMLVANSIDMAACAMVVDKLRTDPSNRAPIIPVFIALKQKLGAIAATAARSNRAVSTGLLKLIIPGLKRYIDNSLYVPTVMLEKEEGQAALLRSKALTDRLRSLVRRVQMRDFFIAGIFPLVTLLTLVSCGLLIDALQDILIRWSAPEWLCEYTYYTDSFPIYLLILMLLIPTLFVILVHPVIAIALLILYFKTRQIGGETLDGVFNRNLESADISGRPKLQRIRAAILSVILLLATAGWFTVKDDMLVWAAKLNRDTTLKALLYAGANANASYKNQITALSIAVAAIGHNENIQPLIYAGANVNLRDESGRTALFSAVYADKPWLVERLVAEGADVNAKNNQGITALMWAVSEGKSSYTVKALLALGADVNAKSNNYGETALMIAVSWPFSSTGIVKELLAAGADVNAKDKDGQTALMLAAKDGNTYIIQPLIDAGADLNVRDNSGETALMLAAKSSFADVVRILKTAGAQTGTKEEAFIIEAAAGNTAAALELIASGIDVNTKYTDKTGLMYAAESGKADCVKALIAAGADIAATDNKYGRTALMYAADRLNVETVQALIAAGADVNAKDKEGITALTRSVANSSIRNRFTNPLETMKTLLDAGAGTNPKDRDEALRCAALSGNADAVKVLIAAGADVNAIDKDGHTVLTAVRNRGNAANGGYFSVIKLLKSSGAKP